MASLCLACVLGCSLINMDGFDYASDPEATIGDAASLTDGMGSADASSADDAATADAFMSDDVSVSGNDSAACGSCDAMQVEDAPDVAPASKEAGSTGSTSGSSGSGGSSGTTSGSASGSVSGSASGSRSGSGSGTSGGTGTSDGHKCGSNGLKPQAAVASSLQSASNLPASSAIDGVFSTRWASAVQTDPSWIYVDFGAPVFVDELEILWQAACATAYDIDVSNDAMSWTNVKSVTGTPPSWEIPPTGWTMDDVEQGLSAKGRYLRIHGTARFYPMYGYSIWEMRAFGDTDASCTP
jgi:hypothetical protein